MGGFLSQLFQNLSGRSRAARVGKQSRLLPYDSFPSAVDGKMLRTSSYTITLDTANIGSGNFASQYRIFREIFIVTTTKR